MTKFIASKNCSNHFHESINTEQEESEDSDKSSERGEIKESEWKTEQYWQLPPNVRKAIDYAKQKKKHSDFYYKLRLLNDKIHIFTSIFYSRVPNYQ